MVKRLGRKDIDWREGVPVAPEFDDVYYSLDDGLEETNFVFLSGIGAPDTWQYTDQFVIAETGFGTGLNFLATYQKWVESGASGRLIYVSVEAYPMSEEALERAHEPFTQVRQYAEKLRAAWPPPSPGFHPRYFEEGKVQLLLLFGDAATNFAELQGEVDAWYLDGFAPAKNPDMWSEELFDQIARLSKPGARFATFTAAGFVKRGLAARGFDVQKTRGFGRKRERLIGCMRESHAPTPPAKTQDWAKLPTPPKRGSIAIVGAGIAGRSLAAALKRRGHADIKLIDGSIACASQVPAAILAPGFQAGKQPTTDFVTAAFAHACQHPEYENAWADASDVEIFSSDEEDRNRQDRVRNSLGWGDDWVAATDRGLVFPKSGSLETAEALANLWPETEIIQMLVENLDQTSNGWLLSGPSKTLDAETIVFASGFGTLHLASDAKHFSIRPRAGQVEAIRDERLEMPDGNFSSGCYATATIDGRRTIGSTFRDHDPLSKTRPKPSSDQSDELVQKVEAAFGCNIDLDALDAPWTGVRATVRDYVPIVGPVPDWDKAASRFAPLAKNAKAKGLGMMDYQKGLYVLTGFGSKGYQQAPYAAEYLAAHLCGQPLPMAQNVAAYLHPARNFIRQLVRSSAS